MKPVVLDASVAAALFLQEEGTATARQLWMTAAGLLAPSFLLLELASSLLRNERKGRAPPGHAERAMAELRTGGVMQLVDTDPLLDHAVSLARDLQHHVYDCLYLALCRRDGAMLATFDRPLAQHARALAIELWTPEAA